MVDAVMEADWPSTVGICCCCLSEGEYKDMMKEYEWTGEKEVYADMLQQCFDLSMMTIPGEDSSRLICELCVTRLRDANRFRLQVEHAQINYVDRISTFRISQEKNSTELKVEFDWQAQVDDSDDNYFDDPNFSHFKKTPDDDDDEEFKIEDVKKKARAPKRKCTKSRAKVAELSEDDIKAESDEEFIIKVVKTEAPKRKCTKTKAKVAELSEDDIKAETDEAGAEMKPDLVRGLRISPAVHRNHVQTDNWTMRSGKKCQNVQPMNAKMRILLDKVLKVKTGNNNKVISKKVYKKKKLGRHNSKYDENQHFRSHTKPMFSPQYMEEFRNDMQTLIRCTNLFPFRWRSSQYACTVCSKTFCAFDILESHMKTHTTEHIIDTYSRRTFYTTLKMNVNSIICKLCDVSIQDIKSLIEHLSVNHEEMLSDHFDEFIHPYNMSDDAMSCVLCGESFVSFMMLNRHINVHYPNYICDVCGKSFATPSRFQAHANSHVMQNFPCPRNCGKTFDTANKRAYHIVKVHKNKEIYKCPRCDLRFHCYFTRCKHLKDVHNEKFDKYVCKTCLSRFPSSGRLSAHVRRMHLKERNFVCGEAGCESAFYTKTELHEHSFCHTGEKMFICQLCPKSYPRKKSLREHMRIHENDRRFVCTECGKSFTQKCTLKCHLKSHDRDRATI